VSDGRGVPARELPGPPGHFPGCVGRSLFVNAWGPWWELCPDGYMGEGEIAVNENLYYTRLSDSEQFYCTSVVVCFRLTQTFWRVRPLFLPSEALSQ